MKTRPLALALLIAASLCLAAGCSPKPVARKQGKLVIGFSIATDTFILERWNKDLRIFSESARDLGAEVVVQIAAGGTKEQISQIEYLLKRDIDALVIIAHDTDMLAGIVKKAKDMRIPVIAYDRLIMGVPIDAFVSFDNRDVGRLFGKALVAAVPRGKYLVVNGSVRDSNSYEVNAGLHEALDPEVRGGSIDIVKEIWLEQWSSDEALEKVGRIFDQRTDIDAISCGDDQLAGAAIQVLAEHQLAGKVAVVGQDADIGACQKVVEGIQLMTVYKPIARLASRAAEVTVAVAQGRALKPDRFIDNKSGKSVPYFVEEPMAVFKRNMDETVVKDGFHSSEDVYRNLQRQGKK